MPTMKLDKPRSGIRGSHSLATRLCDAILFLLCSTVTQRATAQSDCATDHMHEHHMSMDPHYASAHERLQESVCRVLEHSVDALR